MARALRYLVYRSSDKYPPRPLAVAGLLAVNDTAAQAWTEEIFGAGFRVDRYRRPVGWKDEGGTFYTKDSAHGVKYMCKQCLWDALGMRWPESSPRHHVTWCPIRAESK